MTEVNRKRLFQLRSDELTHVGKGTKLCVVGRGTDNMVHRHTVVTRVTKLYIVSEHWIRGHAYTDRHRRDNSHSVPRSEYGGTTVHVTCQRPTRQVTEHDISVLVSRLINEGWDKAQYKSEYTNDAKWTVRLVKAAAEAGYAETYVDDVITKKVRVTDAGRAWLAQRSAEVTGRSSTGKAEPYYGPKIR